MLDLDLEQITKLIDTYAIPWSINLLMAIVIFFVGRFFVNLIISLLHRILLRAKVDEMLAHFLEAIAHTLLLVFVIVAALNQLGVDTSSLVALLAAAGLAIGLSLQSSLQNFAAGIMLLVFKPFKVGDFIHAAGAIGIVETIHIFTCTLRSPDNVEIIVPNGKIYNGNIINNSAKPTRRVDMVFGVSYNDDIRKVKAILTEIVNDHPLTHDDPEPLIAVGELADSSVNFLVRPWTDTLNFGIVKREITEAVKLRFDDEGITIPYPQMDVHLNKLADNN